MAGYDLHLCNVTELNESQKVKLKNNFFKNCCYRDYFIKDRIYEIKGEFEDIIELTDETWCNYTYFLEGEDGELYDICDYYVEFV